MRREKIFLVFVTALFLVSVVSAEIGLGMSPSRMIEHVVAGESQFIEITVFNVGDEDVNITLVPKGDIVKFVTITPAVQTVEPEPRPHEFPVKNGRIFYVVIDVPKGTSSGEYYGTFSAIGSGDGVSQLGANVAVVAQMELNVLKTKSFFARLNPSYYFAIGLILIGFAIAFSLKNFKLQLKVKKKVEKKRK